MRGNDDDLDMNMLSCGVDAMKASVLEIAHAAVLIHQRQAGRACAEDNCFRSQTLAESLSDTYELRCAVRLAVDQQARLQGEAVVPERHVTMCGMIEGEIHQLWMLRRMIRLIEQLQICADTQHSLLSLWLNI